MGLFPLVISARMIIDVRWCLNIATRNCFCQHFIQANYLLCPFWVCVLTGTEQSRNCLKILNLFCWPKPGKKALLASASYHQCCTTARPALFVSLKRSWLGTKVHEWGTWDTGKSEPVLPCRAALSYQRRVLPCSALPSAHQTCTQAKEGGTTTLCKESGISPLSLGTQRLHSSLLGSSTSVPRALPCSGGQSRAALHKPFVGLGAALGASLPSAEGWNPAWSVFIWSFCSSSDRQSLNNDMEYSN